MSKTYDVSIRIPAGKLATIIETLDGEGELLGVVATPGAERKERKSYPATARGRGQNGLRAVDLVLATLNGGQRVSSEVLGKAFLANGFSINSYSPAISNLVKQGKVAIVGKGTYQILPQQRDTTK